MVTTQEFVQEVKAMRMAQTSYFSTRSKGALIRAKQHEAAVDKMIVELQTKEVTP